MGDFTTKTMGFAVIGKPIPSLGHTKLIPRSTEHQGNEVRSASRKEKLIKYYVISCYFDIKKIIVLAQTLTLV